MPQMMPMNWLYLYLVFLMTMSLITLINYFNKLTFNITNLPQNKKNKYYWKW